MGKLPGWVIRGKSALIAGRASALTNPGTIRYSNGSRVTGATRNARKSIAPMETTSAPAFEDGCASMRTCNQTEFGGRTILWGRKMSRRTDLGFGSIRVAAAGSPRELLSRQLGRPGNRARFTPGQHGRTCSQFEHL